MNLGLVEPHKDGILGQGLIGYISHPTGSTDSSWWGKEKGAFQTWGGAMMTAQVSHYCTPPDALGA